jgi:hypothetical protein
MQWCADSHCCLRLWFADDLSYFAAQVIDRVFPQLDMPASASVRAAVRRQ